MHVLVIGYGKIGRIKALNWQSLGRQVIVFDTNTEKRQQATTDGFALFEDSHKYRDLIADISTPASFHLTSLEWMLSHVTPMPRSVLIEKPLVSNETELNQLMQLLDANPTLNDRLVVNESYHLSTALRYVAQDIVKSGAKITSIKAELSKNRLNDIAQGRFTDDYLGPLGIELPHMIAMVQALGMELKHIDIQDVAIVEDKHTPHNSGFTIDLRANGISVTMSSYLGNFRLDNDRPVLNKDIVRSLEVETTAKVYKVLFDPVAGHQRYMSEVSTVDPTFKATERIVMEDNHLKENLQKLHRKTKHTDIDRLLSIHNSVAVSNFIFELKKAAQHKDIAAISELT